ncbi:MAG: aldehyde dehydrogenase family protein, partial [Chitinophagaceae bacterium]
MLTGHNFIGFEKKAAGEKTLKAFSTVNQAHLPGDFIIATKEEVEEAVAKAAAAFEPYRQTTTEERAGFLEAIATEIEELGDDLIQR